MKTITIKDVAKLSGVSISTVSRVLNAPESVKTEKREKVLKAIKQLNYHPNALARGLIYKRTKSIGVLIPDISNPFVAGVIRGMEDEGRELGVNLILCNTDRNQERMVRYLKVLKEKQVDGIVFTSDPINEEYYQIFNEIDLPIVLAATESREYNIPSVKIEDEKAAYDAALYLIEKGHTEIGMISGPTTDTIAGFPRYMGFKQGLRDKLSLENNNIEFGFFDYDSSYKAMERLYDKNPKITAVFCASDEMALGAISFLNTKGINVPEDISILGFDNTKIAQMSIPKLTTISQPMYEIGKHAILKLEKMISGESLEDVVTYLPHTIVERESVKHL
ncbi:LacI family DNA-binding transcriptional regulator [Thalassobacillus sp. B23F22_16]|uniref:LacI family DNA-binding transcriptional regulator n=1 Tax=Thalassobacillus sp. B23F22_16 TaxID=3459513 RepID=UPI00373F2290